VGGGDGEVVGVNKDKQSGKGVPECWSYVKHWRSGGKRKLPLVACESAVRTVNEVWLVAWGFDRMYSSWVVMNTAIRVMPFQRSLRAWQYSTCQYLHHAVRSNKLRVLSWGVCRASAASTGHKHTYI
jgi:hypothetical protein